MAFASERKGGTKYLLADISQPNRQISYDPVLGPAEGLAQMIASPR